MASPYFSKYYKGFLLQDGPRGVTIVNAPNWVSSGSLTPGPYSGFIVAENVVDRMILHDPQANIAKSRLKSESVQDYQPVYNSNIEAEHPGIISRIFTIIFLPITLPFKILEWIINLLLEIIAIPFKIIGWVFDIAIKLVVIGIIVFIVNLILEANGLVHIDWSFLNAFFN
jgi:hypothetical protein